MADEKIRSIDIIDAEVKEALLQVKKITDQTAESTRILTEETKKLAFARKLGLSGNENQANIKKAKKDLIDLEKRSNVVKKKALKLEKELQAAKKKTALEAKKAALAAEKANKKQALSFKNLRAAAGQVLAIWIALKAAVAGFSKLKDTLILLDNFKFSLQKLTRSSLDTEESMRFLIATSKRFGTSLGESVDRYVKFFAAAKQAGVTVEDTREIFVSMSNAAGTLGLRADETRGIFLALEQMFSKGKVTTEELRRQLGERLPGAFGIMADTMNKLRPEIEITVNDLDEMLKKGEVISGEVLPEFARQVEIAFGIQSRERIDTLAAAQSRLGTAWTEFIFEVENGGGTLSKTFISFFNSVTEGIEKITELQLAFDQMNGFQRTGTVLSYVNPLLFTWLKMSDENIELLADQSRATSTHAKAVADLAILLQGLQKDQGIDVEIAQIKLDIETQTTEALTDQITAINDRAKAIEEANKAQGETPYTVKFYQELIKAEQNFVDTKLTDADVDVARARQSQEMIAIWKRQIALIQGTTKAIKAKEKVDDIYNENAEGILEVNQRVIGSLQEMRDQLTDLNAIKLFDGLIEQASGDFSKLIELPDLEVGVRLAPAAEGFQEQMTKLFALAAPEFPISNLFGGQSAEKLAQEYQEVVDALQEGEILSYEDFLKKKIRLEEQYVQASKALVNGLFDIGNALAERRLEDIQAEIEATERKFDALYDAAEGDKDHQNDIRAVEKIELEKLRVKELKQRQKIAKGEKAQALANVAMNTAVAVSKVWGQVGIFGLAAQIPVLIMGALQAAVIAAQPIPKYKTGTDSAKAGLGIVGDGGRPEVVVGKRGSYVTPSTPTMTFFEKGDKVYKSEADWARRTSQSIAPIMEMTTKYDLEDAIRKGFEKAKVNNWIKLPKPQDIDHLLWLNSQQRF